MAAPMAVGIAALMLIKNPNLDGVTMRRIIMDSSERISALQNYSISGGRVNAYGDRAMDRRTFTPWHIPNHPARISNKATSSPRQ
jgi:hypothetical protein